ncbi:hypothetical protein F4782DRAFT_549305 [Xylaria castorea]|nr:hypothetical protein F4782DRAFT_549305 [Xylaria castorea]
MSATNDRAGNEVAQEKLMSEELQPDPESQPPSRTTSFKDVDSEVRKQHRAVSGWLSEVTLSIDKLIPESNELVKQRPEVLDIARDIKQAISHVQSHIVPGTHLAGSHRSKITYLDLVTELSVLKSKITQLRENCDAILSTPKYKSSPRWPRVKNRHWKTEVIEELQARLRDVARTLELLGASMTITAALEQKSLEKAQTLNSITEALRNSPPSQHIFPEGKSTLGQLANRSTGQLVLRKEQGRQIHDTILRIDQRFDKFHGPTMNDSNFARHQYFRSERLDGTCDWLIRTRKFWDEWLLGSYGTCKTLFCWGAPGVGKSTIASRVIDELARMKRVHAFYYLGDCGVNSVERLLLSLLTQIQVLNSEVVPANSAVHSSGFDSHYSLMGNDAAEIAAEMNVHASTKTDLVTNPLSTAELSRQASSHAPSFSSFHAQRRDTFKVLLDALFDVISGIDDTVFIVIDAWEKEKMEFGSERNFYALLGRIRIAGCRVFLTSRTTPNSTIPFEYIPLPVEESDIRGDIDSFIQIRMNDIFTEDLKFPTAPRFRTSIDSDPVKRFLGSFTLATLFLSYVRAVLSKSKESRSRVLFASMTKTSIRASIFGQLLIRPADFLGCLEPEGLMKGNIERLTRGPSSLQIKSTLVWLTFAVAPLPFEVLNLALEQISTPLQSSEPQPNPNVERQKEMDLLAILVQLDGLVVWDRGNHLIRLASDEVGKVAKSLWFSTYEPNITVPSTLGTSILGRICLYYIQYILAVQVEDTSLQSETTANELLQKYPFLSHAVLGWSTYCREFYNLMTARSRTQQEVSSPVILSAKSEKHDWAGDGANFTDTAEEDEEYGTHPTLKMDFLAVETPVNQSPDQSTYLDSLHHEVSARISKLIRDKPKLSMAILLAAYLNPTSSISHLDWEALYSWVMSTSELLMVSRLGLNDAVKGMLKSDSKHLSVGDEQGNTPLHEAAKYGFEDMVRTLLSAGASVVVRNKLSMTPAEYAIHYGQNQSFILIFEKMAALDVLGENSALMFKYCDCIVGNKGDQRRRLDLTLFHAIRTSTVVISRYLLKHGADPDGFNDEGTPILHHAIRYSGIESGDQFSFLPNSGPELLLLHGADPDIQSKDSKKESALHVAVRWGKLGTMRRLLKYGVDPRTKNSEGQPPLFAMFDEEAKFVNYNYRGIILDLVNRGADLNQPDDNNRRVLHLAAQNSLSNVIWLLIGLGAACDLRDAAGKVPLDYAKDTKDEKSMDLLQPFASKGALNFEYTQ